MTDVGKDVNKNLSKQNKIQISIHVLLEWTQIDQQIWFQSEWFLTGSSLSPVLGKAYIGSCWVLGGHCENKIK